MVPYLISFAGAGRVAGALCRKLSAGGSKIDLVVSESNESSRILAASCNASWSRELVFPESSQVIIVSVPDHKLKDILDRIVCSSDTLVAHTAGSVGLDVFPERIANKGVLYPLQTFSKERHVDFCDLPFFIEASDKISYSILERIADSIGGKVFNSDTGNRRMLHLAAVFACNFSNHMLTISKEIVQKSGFEFEVLFPLINETVSKALEIGPEKSQTGPALRNDKNIIDKHMELLSYSPELERMYGEITLAIRTYHNSR